MEFVEKKSVKEVTGYGLDDRRLISVRQRVCTVCGRQPFPFHLILTFADDTRPNCARKFSNSLAQIAITLTRNPIMALKNGV
jgi:hypothetical protein